VDSRGSVQEVSSVIPTANKDGGFVTSGWELLQGRTGRIQVGGALRGPGLFQGSEEHVFRG